MSGAQRRPSRKAIETMQNRVRGAVNPSRSDHDGRRQGAHDRLLKPFIQSVLGGHADAVSLRKVRSAPPETPEYVLAYNGELLFRLVWVPWEDANDWTAGRWHVRRHPDADWWRTGSRRRR